MIGRPAILMVGAFFGSLSSCIVGADPTALPIADPIASAEATAPKDVAMPAHANAVVEYTLQAKLDAGAHTIHGTGTLAWKNTSRVPVKELWFHLYLNAFKNQRSVYLREPLGNGRGGGPIADWGTIDVRKLTWKEANADLWTSAEVARPGDEDETDARVPLPREVAPGETITLEMTWDDKLPSIIERTGYAGSFHFVGQWFPKIARLEPDGTWAHFAFHRLSEFYADFGKYDVTLDVPATHIVGATGKRTEERVEGDRRILRHVESDIHDFAWTAWDKWVVREENIAGVAVRALGPPGYERVLERELASMRFALPYFGARYGMYPYGELTLVHPPETAPEAGGMEYPTLITTGGRWWTPNGMRTVEGVTIHEFGHQYFYGLLASNENRWPFLDEGLNSFAEFDSMRAWLGPGAAWDGLGLTIDNWAIASTFSDEGSLTQAVGQPAPKFQTFELYGRLVYLRSAAILETFRRVYDRAAFDEALGTYTRKFRFGHPTPDDLIDALGARLGKEAAANLRTALFDKGWVDYEILGMASDPKRPAEGLFDRGGKRETVKAPADKGDSADYEGWVLVARKGSLSFPVTIDLVLENGARETLQWDGATETAKLPFHTRARVVTAIVDPLGKVLLDQNPRNNAHLNPQSSAYGSFSTTERVVYAASTLLDLVAP